MNEKMNYCVLGAGDQTTCKKGYQRNSSKNMAEVLSSLLSI